MRHASGRCRSPWLPVLATGLLLLATACRDGADTEDGGALEEHPPQQIAEKEPNGQREQAQVIDGPTVVDGAFEPGTAPDADWFRVVAEPRSIVRMELTPAESGARLAVFDADADARPLSRIDVDAGTTGILPNVSCETACFVQVTPPAGNEPKGDPTKRSGYALTLLPSPPHARSEREPNDTRTTAQPLSPGGIVDGYLAPPGDEDWYAVSTKQLAEGEVLSFALTPPRTVRAEISVVGPAGGEPLATWRAPAPGEALRMRNLTPPVTDDRPFFLVVRGAREGERGRGEPSADPTTPYTLDLRSSPRSADSEIEPNDSAARATPLSGGDVARTGFLAPKGDVDWFVFEAPGPSVLRAEVSAVGGVDVALVVLTPDDSGAPRQLARVDDGGPDEPEIVAGVPIPAGKCWIRVEGGAGKRSRTGPGAGAQGSATSGYTLTHTLDPDDGSFEREPNDRTTNATPIAVGASIRGHLHPANDVDLFRLELTEPTNVVLTVTGVPRLDVSLVVRDGAETDARGAHPIIGTVDRNRVEGDERLVVPFEPGVYFLELRSKGGASNPRQTYTLTAK